MSADGLLSGYLLILVVIETELHSNDISAANGIVYRLCILKHSAVNLIIYKIYVFEIHPLFVEEDLGFTTLLTSQVISISFYNEREKSDKFCSEALISA